MPHVILYPIRILEQHLGVLYTVGIAEPNVSERMMLDAGLYMVARTVEMHPLDDDVNFETVDRSGLLPQRFDALETAMSWLQWDSRGLTDNSNTVYISHWPVRCAYGSGIRMHPVNKIRQAQRKCQS